METRDIIWLRRMFYKRVKEAGETAVNAEQPILEEYEEITNNNATNNTNTNQQAAHLNASIEDEGMIVGFRHGLVLKNEKDIFFTYSYINRVGIRTSTLWDLRFGAMVLCPLLLDRARFVAGRRHSFIFPRRSRNKQTSLRDQINRDFSASSWDILSLTADAEQCEQHISGDKNEPNVGRNVEITVDLGRHHNCQQLRDLKRTMTVRGGINLEHGKVPPLTYSRI